MKSSSNLNMYLEQKEINRGYPRNCLFEFTLFRQYNPFSIWKDVTMCCFKCVKRLLDLQTCGGIIIISSMRGLYKRKRFKPTFLNIFRMQGWKMLYFKASLNGSIFVALNATMYKWHLPFSSMNVFLWAFVCSKIKRECWLPRMCIAYE